MAGKQGFASMAPERVKAIAGQGGKAAHQKGTAHQWTPEEAKVAGRKGGMACRGRRRVRRPVYGPEMGIE